MIHLFPLVFFRLSLSDITYEFSIHDDMDDEDDDEH